MPDSEFDLREVFRSYRQMGASAHRAGAFFRELRPLARKQTSFREDQALKWKRRARSTVRKIFEVEDAGSGTRLRIRGHRLRILGRLPRLYKVFADQSGIVMRHRLPEIAGAHNTGRRVGNRAQLPVREFAFWRTRFLDKTVRSFADFVVRAGKQ